MADPKTHELFTFATSSKGGLGAVVELSKAYGKMMRQRPDHIPIVKLGFGSYKPRDLTRSRVKFPIFEVTGWTDKQPYDTPRTAPIDCRRARSRHLTYSALLELVISPIQ